jgi:hypothetical protein
MRKRPTVPVSAPGSAGVIGVSNVPRGSVTTASSSLPTVARGQVGDSAVRGPGERRVRFEVADDGPGFAPGRCGGRGVENIRDRVGALGGTVQWHTAPGAGTRVCGFVPA